MVTPLRGGKQDESGAIRICSYTQLNPFLSGFCMVQQVCLPQSAFFNQGEQDS